MLFFYYEKCIEIDDSNENAYVNHGSCLAELGFFEKAIKSYDFALNLNPNMPRVLINRGYCKKKNIQRVLYGLFQSLRSRVLFSI